MVWNNPDLSPLIIKAKNLVSSEFFIKPNIPIFICTVEEMKQGIQEELIQRQLPEEKKLFIEKQSHRVLGKFFKFKKEIWLVHKKGEDMDTLIHELLHSIQQCLPNRERIVFYLTYKLTKVEEAIPIKLKNEWMEIEHQEGHDSIKNRLLTNGDCEDFS